MKNEQSIYGKKAQLKAIWIFEEIHNRGEKIFKKSRRKEQKQ